MVLTIVLLNNPTSKDANLGQLPNPNVGFTKSRDAGPCVSVAAYTNISE